MSPIDSILGIRELVVQVVKRTKGLQVWAGQNKWLACVYWTGYQLRVKVRVRRWST